MQNQMVQAASVQGMQSEAEAGRADAVQLPSLGREDDMSGLRFDSPAQMPEGMKRLYCKKVQPKTAEAVTKSKYHAIKTDERGISFDSKKEAARYIELLTMLECGEIADLKLQPQFTLQESYITENGQRIRAIRYTADFSYRRAGRLIVEDVKSTATRTKEYLRNKKMVREKYGIDIQEV